MLSVILNCSDGMEIYILKDEKIYESITNNMVKHTDELLSELDKMLKDAEADVSEIDNICVCIGPGSFTGIRVAVAISKGLAIGTGAKVFVCSNFDILKFKENKNKKIIYVLDAFSKYVYIRKVIDGKFFEDCVDIDEIKKYNTEEWDIVSGSEKVQNRLKNIKIQSYFAEKQIISVFKNKIQKDDFSELNAIDPIYLRASQAEIEREKRLKK